ncbi:MAG: DUF2249 domain-containing protein, partial [Bacteroidales bacterium]|nr:DUF2249 domain-containing protein [Bacteroidales bacterium]
TKISEIIKENIKAIEVIASVNRNFKKLENPFLRKLFASRVSIKDAAKIGGSSVNDILKKLEEIGFKVEISENKNDLTEQNNTKLMKKDKIVKLDVRPILETGTDPYHAIMDTLKTMNTDETLLIVNTFEPVPLLNKLKSQGYEYEVERPDENTVYTYLSKNENNKESEQTENEDNSEFTFEDAEKKYAGRMHEIDVRDLEMPMPMVTILEEIEKISDDKVLYVHHKRLPQYLLPELKTRGWKYVNKEVDNENMKFIIYKN